MKTYCLIVLAAVGATAQTALSSSSGASSGFGYNATALPPKLGMSPPELKPGEVMTTYTTSYLDLCTCSQTYTTKTYTVTEPCPSESVGKPRAADHIPTGFAATTTTCTECGTTPVTATLTCPTPRPTAPAANKAAATPAPGAGSPGSPAASGAAPAGSPAGSPPGSPAGSSAGSPPYPSPGAPAPEGKVAAGPSASVGSPSPAESFTGAANRLVNSGMSAMLAIIGVLPFAL